MRYINLFVRAALLAILLIAAPQISDAASPVDEALAKTVTKKLLEDKSLDASNLTVTSESGKIFLRGQMKNESDISKVRDIVTAVPGVNEVVEEIAVPESK